MSPELVSYMASIQAEAARIEGMKADNLSATSPEVVPHRGVDFFAIAHGLDNIAHNARNAQ